MAQQTKKPIQYYIRFLHRNIGFFLFGLLVVYSLSGIVLIYRDTNFLKHEVIIEKQLSPGLEEPELTKAIGLRNFRVEKNEGDTIYFQNGKYDKVSGSAIYSVTELPGWLNKFISLHKSTSQNTSHWFTTIFGILLFFMAISSFWMFKPDTGFFRKGLYVAGAGIVAAIILLFFLN